MNYIPKSPQEPKEFKRWRTKVRGNHSRITGKPRNVEVKALTQTIKNILLNEQGFLCCYCESQITEKSSHIEHLQPKGKPEFAQLISAYSNLLCSCNHPNSCGTAKQNHIIEVTPLNRECQYLFVYKQNGKIQGTVQKATNTIQTLNLDSERLRQARAGICEVFNNLPVLSLTDYDRWVNENLAPDTTGRLKPFWSTIKYFADQNRCYFE